MNLGVGHPRWWRRLSRDSGHSAEARRGIIPLQLTLLMTQMCVLDVPGGSRPTRVDPWTLGIVEGTAEPALRHPFHAQQGAEAARWDEKPDVVS